MATAPPSAVAGELTVYSCHTPAGAAIGDYGWQPEHDGGTFILLDDTCAQGGAGGLLAELPGRGSGYADGEAGTWEFDAPAWARIAKYTLHVSGSYAYPGQGTGSGQTYISASDERDPVYDYRNLGGGGRGAETIERTPPDAVRSVYVNASCDSGCPGGPAISQIEVDAAAFLLDDSVTPTVSDLTGSLTASGTLAGTVEASFRASEDGPGIYSAHFVVDGQAQPPVALDTNGGLCEDLGETADGTRAFSSPAPCAQEVQGGASLETTRFPDGEHHVELVVEDAGGGQALAYNATVTFDNAPAPAPTSGPTEAPGALLPPPPAPLPAPGNGEPASREAVIRLAGSAHFSRPYARRGFLLAGRLVTQTGQPIERATLAVSEAPLAGGQARLIADVTTGSGGVFALRVPRGASRVVTVAYRAFAGDPAYAASAAVTEHVRAGVQLRVSPRATSPEGTIILSGHVLGPVPRHGVIAELLVHYLGHWEPFRAPRTNSRGYFRVVYQFEGAIGRFPFRAKVPGDQQDFSFQAGYSRLVAVRTR